MATADQTKAALLTVLRLAGLTLSLDASSREAVIGGNKQALTVWHALAGVLEELDALVLAGLDAEAVAQQYLVEPQVAGETVAASGPEPEPEPARPPRPGKPGPRTDGGVPYLDCIALGWRARRDAARQRGRGLPFTEPCPYFWDNS